MSQMKMVIDKLLKDGSVSRNWALNNFISRLSALIYTLTHEYGWEFDREKVNSKRPDGSDGWDYVYILKKVGFNPYEKGDKNDSKKT